MKKALQILLIIVCTITASMSLLAQNDTTNQRIILKKNSVSIIPPKHFLYDSISEKISHPGSLSTIQINEIKNRSYKKITGAITEKHMEAQGFTLIYKHETKMQDGSDAIIIRCKFKSNDDKGHELFFIRLMLFTGNENTIWVTADFPECMEKLIEKAIIYSITSVHKN